MPPPADPDPREPGRCVVQAGGLLAGWRGFDHRTIRRRTAPQAAAVDQTRCQAAERRLPASIRTTSRTSPATPDIIGL